MRRQALAALDRAQTLNLITILHGVPRVGRSRLLADWCARRDGVRLETVEAMLSSDAAVQVFDHLDEANVPRFVECFRQMERQGRRSTLLVAPSDLAALLRLERALPGVVGRMELPPLQPDELSDPTLSIGLAAGPIHDLVLSDQPTNHAPVEPDRHWLRGGIPQSYDADTDEASFAWRNSMVQALLARDYSEYKVSPVLALEDAFTWVADQNSNEFDLDKPPQGKKADAKSALYVLEQLGLIRILSNYPAHTEASLAAKRKIYVRDSGLLHARLGIRTVQQLRSSLKIGDSWEAYALETLIVAAAGQATCQFYRQEAETGQKGPDEIDLVLNFAQTGGPIIGIEFKVSPDRKPEDGYARAMKRIGATEGFVVHSGQTSNLDADVHRLDLGSAKKRVLSHVR